MQFRFFKDLRPKCAIPELPDLPLLMVVVRSRGVLVSLGKASIS